MKNTIKLFIGLFLITFNLSGIVGTPGQHVSQNDTLLVFCTPALAEITMRWADEFYGQSGNQQIKVQTVTGTKITESLAEGKGLAFVSGDFSPLYEESMWNMVIGREVTVPVFNSRNPFFSQICQKGVSTEKLAGIIRDPVSADWGKILNLDKSVPAQLYSTDDKSTGDMLSNLEGNGMAIKEGPCTMVSNTRDLISRVLEDPYAIGFCQLSSLLESTGISNSEGIKLLPIDRNNNGKIDHMENIYDDLGMLSRNVWIGKYPHALYRNIYSISSSSPDNDQEISFLKWVVTDGQKYLGFYGYTELVLGEKQAKVGLLDNTRNEYVTAVPKNFIASLKTVGVLVFLLTGLAIITAYLVRRFQKVKVQTYGDDLMSVSLFRTDILRIPLGLFYDKSHTWAYMERDGLVKIGVDDFLQHITGKLTGVKMKNKDEIVIKGEPVLTVIQNGKQLTLNSPVSGKIKELNTKLASDSSLINSSPFSDGWIYRIEPVSWMKEISFFIMGDGYRVWLKNEFTRFKEFLNTTTVKADRSNIPVLQDGGELKDGVLENLGPEVWEEFQVNFINVSA